MSHPLEPGLAESQATRKAPDPAEAEFKTARERFVAPAESANVEHAKSVELSLDGTSFSYSRPAQGGAVDTPRHSKASPGESPPIASTISPTVLDHLINWLSRRLELLIQTLLPSRAERRGRTRPASPSKKSTSANVVATEEGAQGSFLVDQDLLEEIRARRNHSPASLAHQEGTHEGAPSADLVMSSGSEEGSSDGDSGEGDPTEENEFKQTITKEGDEDCVQQEPPTK